MRLYRAPKVFVGTGAPPLDDGAVLVGDDGRIAAVGPAREVSAPGAEVIETQGTLMPGLVDCHVHLCLSGGTDPGGEVQVTPLPVVALQGAAALRAHLAAGVTTVRDLGSVGGIAVALGRLVDAGRLPGPRVIAAGRALCITGGHGAFIGREVDGPWEVAEAVRSEMKAGATCIKVIATGGMMTPGVEPGAPQMTLEEMRAAVSEATRAGRRVAAHAQGSAGIADALRAGVATIEHGIFIDADCLTLFQETGAYLVPTFSATDGILSGKDRGVPDFIVAKMEKAAGSHVASFQKALGAGVHVAAGTDGGTPLNPHGNLAHEIQAMVRYGMPVLEALAAATGHAAAALGRDDVGVLAPGRRADLVALDGDPVDDVEAVEAVTWVMKDGRVFEPADLTPAEGMLL